MSSNIRVNRICQFCGNEFEARTTVTKTCSDNCAKRLYKQRQKETKIQESNKETLSVKLIPIADLQVKEFLNVNEACALLGISRRTIYRMIEKEQLKVGKIGSRTLIKRTEIEKIFG